MGIGTLGDAALVATAVACTVAAAASLARRPAWARRARSAAVAAVGVAVGALAWALLRSDFTLAYVADHGHRDAPFAYRLAALWGGPEGSLLCWTAGLVVVAALATRRRHDAEAADPRRHDAEAALAAVAAAFTVITLLEANPFARLAVPAIDGAGLVPVLEHPLLLVHPPLLYAALLCLAPLWASSLPALRRSAAPDGAERAQGRTAALVAVGTGAAALALGARWAYDVQGWGGYWAWDPVEHAGLVPWLAAVVVLHAAPAAGPRLGTALGQLPWILAVAGTLLARAGGTGSVHAFADDPGLRAALGLLLAVLVVVLVLSVVNTPPAAGDGSGSGAVPDRLRTTGAALTGLAAVVVAVGTAAPLVRDLLGGGRTMVDGSYYARMLAPVGAGALALVTLAALRRPGPHRLAHAGLAVLLVGVAGGAADRHAVQVVSVGEPVEVAGTTVLLTGVRVEPGDRTETVRATLDVDGRTVGPALVVHRDRGQVRATTDRAWWPWRDVVVGLRDADERFATVEVWSRPLVSLVWAGAAMLSLGVLAALRRRRPGPTAPSPEDHPGAPPADLPVSGRATG